MKVTIVVPFYNAERYIERCARSVFEQTHDDLEVVFVDDGCTDNSVACLERVMSGYSSRHAVLLRHERNLGSAMARATGIRHATGEYMLQVDSDDFVAPTYVEELLRAATEAHADIAICHYRRISAHGTERIAVPPVTDRDQLIGRLISGEIHNGLWNKLVRTSLFTQNNIYPLDGVNMFDDKSLMFRLVYFAKKVVFVPRELYNYDRTNPNSLSASSRRCAVEPARRVLALIDEFFAAHPCGEPVVRGIEYFRAQLLALEMLGGPRYTADKPVKVSYRSIVNHPLLPLHYKLAALCRKTGFEPGGKWLRAAMDYVIVRRNAHAAATSATAVEQER